MRRSTGIATRSRAFSLVELLIVIFIVTLVISIILPALGGARRAARSASTQQLLAEVSNSIQTFKLDNNRSPGFYSAREMGADENEDYGLTAMENVLLDLSGGIVQKSGPLNPNEVVKINPTGDSDREIVVDPSLIGASRAGTKAYFTPDDKFFVAQVEDTQQVADKGPTAGAGEPQLPDVVDAWGNPVLAWVQDPLGPLPPCSSDETDWTECGEPFARVSSTDGTSLFYWNSNAGFLKATATGKEQANQKAESLLGEDIATSDEELVSRTMGALLGNPSFPQNRDSSVTGEDIFPQRPRGSVVVQSAGADGVFLSINDKRGKVAIHAEDEPHVTYGQCHKVSAESFDDLLNDKGLPDTVDIIDRFDDLVLKVD